MKLEPIIQVSSAWTAASGRFGVHVFEGHLTIAEMEQMQTTGDDWYRRHPGKLVELVIVFPSDARMSGAERARMTQLIKRWERVRIASATVILASGITGAVQRSVLTGLMMLAPAPHPAKVFGAVPNAVKWIHPYIRELSGEETTEKAALVAVEELCAAFRARTA